MTCLLSHFAVCCCLCVCVSEFGWGGRRGGWSWGSLMGSGGVENALAGLGCKNGVRLVVAQSWGEVGGWNSLGVRLGVAQSWGQTGEGQVWVGTELVKGWTA